MPIYAVELRKVSVVEVFVKASSRQAIKDDIYKSASSLREEADFNLALDSGDITVDSVTEMSVDEIIEAHVTEADVIDIEGE